VKNSTSRVCAIFQEGVYLGGCIFRIYNVSIGLTQLPHIRHRLEALYLEVIKVIYLGTATEPYLKYFKQAIFTLDRSNIRKLISYGLNC
jgi:hypothetical protein